MFTTTRALEETLLQHFIYQKLEIAYAIYKPFPFLEGLRDNSFITETMYRESMEAYRNQVPITRVVYNILTHLEKMFNLSFLQMLFSRINLREYPNLMTIFKSFRSVVISYGGWNRAGPTLLEAPANSTEGGSLQTLLSLPAPQHPLQSLPPRAPSVSEPSASTQQSGEIRGEPPSPPGPAVALPRAAQEGRITPEDSQEMPGTSPATVQEIRDDSPEPNDPKEPQEASSTLPNKKGKKRKRSIWSTPKKRHQKKSLSKGRASPEHRIQEKLRVVDQTTERKDNSTRKSKVVTTVQKAKTGCTQTFGPEEISDDCSEMNEEKRPQEPPSTPPSIVHAASPEHKIQEKLQVVDQTTERKDDSTRNSKVMTRAQKARTGCTQTSEPEEKKRKKDVSSSSTRRCQKNIPPKKKPKDEFVDFHSPQLPVTCGEAKGILYKEKLKQGSSEKCIQNEEGVWFTPKEFEIEGKRATSRKWKQSVHCRGKTLEELLKKGLLLGPPRISVKRKVESSKECEVCCRGGPLLCCITCPRAFHGDCHIPPAEAERSPWSCTFCRMESSGRQQCHRESEVLERQMQPEEQLIRDYGEPFQEAMWLDLIKERLMERVYSVTWFVRDMRLIFHNHKMFYKTSDLGQIGLDLEAEFEKDLKDMFSFCKAKENSFQTL
ncbi:sp110 nuclear body protein isoform X5 [Hyaena hyaena]|uniref:sp110 nuclear body protein isoform X5 n=1 Tax=Hyaena hyaena TaxID=95912 RepID=UPI001920A9DF|nr:sp110 nuclear body protein isoform X5 [Hyaena hyaena]